MKYIQPIISTILLALWMMLSFVISAAVYAAIDNSIGTEGWRELDQVFGGFTIPLTHSSFMPIYWSQVLVCLPICIIMAAPAVWLLRKINTGPNKRLQAIGAKARLQPEP